MTTASLPTVPDIAEFTAAGRLQQVLPHLVALALDAKQAHWNVTGAAFLPLHALTDDLAAEVWGWADRIAERAVALGGSADGRPATIASVNVEQLPAGRLADHEVINELARRIQDTAQVVRGSLVVLEDVDIVAHGIAVDVLEGLEKIRWMLRASQT